MGLSKVTFNPSADAVLAELRAEPPGMFSIFAGLETPITAGWINRMI